MFMIYGFGKLRLAHGKNLVDHFPTQQVEELLAFLLLKPKIRHPREKLIAILWPDLDVPAARHRFSIVLSRLRKSMRTLGVEFEDYFQTTNSWIAFMPKRPYQFDREIFLQLFHKGLYAEDLVQKEATFREALALFPSHLMDGLYTDWCVVEREYLDRLRLRAAGQVMHCCMKRCAYEDAIEFGYDILNDDPLREDVHCALMQCFHAQRRPDLLLKQYKWCSSLLHDELSQPPSDATNDLFQQLMSDLANTRLNSVTSPNARRQLKGAITAFFQAADQLHSALNAV
jgi:DNA-binding SARP family transcriptional activator